MRRHRKTRTAKHRLPAKRDRIAERTIEMVDHAGTAHFLTIDAAENGKPRGQYTAVCSERILPGALVAKVARWCPLCVPIPAQRSR